MAVHDIHTSLLSAGKFQTEIGKSWAAEISSTRNSILTKKQN